MQRLILTAATGFSLLLAACSDSTSQPEQQGPQAELKVLHATAGVGALDVDVGESRVITGLATSRSAKALVPAGSQRVRIRQGSTLLADIETVLTTAHVNVVTIANGAAQVSATVISDTGTAAMNRANIRVINVASGIDTDPTSMHLLINYPGVSPDSTAKLGLDTKIASHGTLMYFDPGQFRFRLVAQGSTTVLAESTVTVAAGEKRAVVIERGQDGAYRMQVVIEQ
jgi:hypothetical protein